ncbi:DUF2339 domain-containing protein [Arenibaculum pallidiluteum]|uniref:DUF2339 domain-containing protein n=1 Tax=Arenibaculum pallidiluteum TaxID=2812559 RepID=UPI001A96B100|nr:DUF2339 domain-containing protein [Arenibaculum pallidiluteum]
MEFLLFVALVAAAYYRIDRRLKGQAREIGELRQALARLTAGQVPSSDPAPTPAVEMAPAEPVPEHVPAMAAQAPPLLAPETVRSRWRELEEALASRWLIWLGGATMALAAAFFVKMSVDQGWLGPGVRIALGMLAGAGLIAGGEWLRRQPDQRAIAAVRPDYVPPALTGAGLFAAFASVYGGFALFELFPPLVAFALLAALSLTGMGLSLLQGPFIAALGLLAGFVTPLLVPSDDPMAWGLFPYLLALSAAAMALVRWRRWGWLGWGTLAGAALWPLLWFVDAWKDGDALPVGLYLVLAAALFLMPAALGEWNETEHEEARPVSGWRAALPTWALRRRRHPADRLAMTAMRVLGALAAGNVWMDGHGGVSLTLMGLFALMSLVVARQVERLAGIAWTAALVVAAALTPWNLPVVPDQPPVLSAEGQPLLPAVTDGLPGEVLRFLWVTGGFAALFGIGAFIVLWQVRRLALWASLSAVTPLGLLALAYALVEPPYTAAAWPAAALGLAALLVGATAALGRHRHRPGASLGMAAFAAGAVGAISLGATMILREAWLTVALSLQVPVLAWLERQLNLRALRGVALLVAGAVLVRLVINPYVLDYEGLAWIFYGYGLPAAGFLIAAHWMRGAPDGRGDDLTVMVLEAGGLIFTVLMISLGIHHWMAGSLAEAPSTLAETALHTLSWLGLAVLLAIDPRWNARLVAVWGRRVLTILAAAQVVALHMLELNPLWTIEPVGDWPVMNRLLLAYGLPGLLGVAYLWLDPPRPARLRQVLPLLPAALFALNLALEIRRAFQGPVLSGGVMTDAEWYSYSAGFLLFALALLVASLRLGWGWVRHAALALVLAVVAKVFLSDMNDLEGFYRVASFLGLGVSLVAIGYFYQRVLLPSVRGEGD